MSQIILSILLLIFFFNSAHAKPEFRLTIQTEPSTLDQTLLKSPGSSYLISQLHRNLFFIDENMNLQSDIAKKCGWISDIQYKCELQKNIRWSDGSLIVAQDFLRTYQHFLNPDHPSFRKDFLINIKNAKTILQRKLPMDSLGILINNDYEIIFNLETPDPELPFKLALDITAPTKTTSFPSTNFASNFISSGPYKIKAWEKSKKITLEPNPHFDSDASIRPAIVYYFVADDNTALNLYETGKIDFLRRLPTLFIPKFQNRSDFKMIPMQRFDYIGFGPSLKNKPNIRKALAESLDYFELQALFSAPPRPGCVGLSNEWTEKQHCYQKMSHFISEAEVKSKIKFLFSKQGGEDHKRATEWLQFQWKKHLGLQVDLEQRENKTFLEELEKSPPDIFRKGINLEIPTCHNALHIFTTTHPENYLKYSNSKYDQKVQELLASYKNSFSNSKKICSEAIDILMRDSVLIPLGPISFAMLIKPEIKNFKINGLNQVILKDLRK